MIIEYTLVCPCGFSAQVTYGEETKERVHEVFSCMACRNMFTVISTDPRVCPECDGHDLVQYNPNREKNMAFYKKMKSRNLLKAADYRELMKFWKRIEETMCPSCRKHSLDWSAL